MVGAMGAYQRLLGMPERTVVYVCGVLTALYLARFFTATTSDSQMLDTCARFAAPAGRLGANPEAIALAAAIMVRSIPHIVHLMANARKAARARHLRARYMPRVLVPVVIAAIGYALSTHDALRARNLESSERAPA